LERLPGSFQCENNSYTNCDYDGSQSFGDIETLKLEDGLSNIYLSPPFPSIMVTVAWGKAL
tara:strand:+ start:370 stop:552 length:183 start_codon:yes stop_codon:yes gene_type:complete